jgi:hypothetical protein
MQYHQSGGHWQSVPPNLFPNVWVFDVILKGVGDGIVGVVHIALIEVPPVVLPFLYSFGLPLNNLGQVDFLGFLHVAFLSFLVLLGLVVEFVGVVVLEDKLLDHFLLPQIVIGIFAPIQFLICEACLDELVSLLDFLL